MNNDKDYSSEINEFVKLTNEKERMRRERQLDANLERLHEQNVRGVMNVPTSTNESLEGVKSEDVYKADVKRRRLIGAKIENWIVLALLLGSIVVALASCNVNSDDCMDDYILESHIPTYMTCNAEQLIFTYKMDTVYRPISKCECQHQRDALEDSFWSMVDETPVERQFMYFERPMEIYCVKK